MNRDLNENHQPDDSGRKRQACAQGLISGI